VKIIQKIMLYKSSIYTENSAYRKSNYSGFYCSHYCVHVFRKEKMTQIFRISAWISVDIIVRQIFGIFGFEIIQAQAKSQLSGDQIV
jgi:hypothetical protein